MEGISEDMEMRTMFVIALALPLAAIMVAVASAETAQERIEHSFLSCLEIKLKYDFSGETPEQIHRDCAVQAYEEVFIGPFIDDCVAHGTRWLNWGRRAECVELAKKQFGY
jgi:hypothetical protein